MRHNKDDVAVHDVDVALVHAQVEADDRNLLCGPISKLK